MGSGGGLIVGWKVQGDGKGLCCAMAGECQVDQWVIWTRQNAMKSL